MSDFSQALQDPKAIHPGHVEVEEHQLRVNPGPVEWPSSVVAGASV